MKIFTVIGARPQFVKAAVVSRVLRESEGMQEVIVHTGQHFDDNMSEIFFREMDIPSPNYKLHINSLSHGKMTGRMMEGLEDLMLSEKSDVVLIYGDTNSTLAGAITAAKLGIPIAHVEAGLRSYNLAMPEEINRILSDRVSKWLFCPTEQSVNNLKTEGFENFLSKIYLVGDVMYDAILYYRNRKTNYSSQLQKLPDCPFILATLHRQENINNYEKLKCIVEGLNKVHYDLYPVIMPMHPGTSKIIQKLDLKIAFQTIAPVGYFDMLRLLELCKFVITDSGGVQKEAYFSQKFCLTLRDETEWVELIEIGVNKIIGTDIDLLFKTIQYFMHQEFPSVNGLYGDGHAAELILKGISD